MSDSRTSNSIKNVILNISNQVLTIFLSFVSRTVFLRVLSVEYLGISGLFGDIFSMLSLADLGFGTAMTYSMYKPLAEKDYTKLAGLVSFYKKVYRIIAFTITTLGIALIPFLEHLVNTDKKIPYLTLYYVLILANTVASYLVVYKTSILSADQKGYLIGKYSMIFNIVRTICMIVFLLITRNYAVYLGVQVAFTYIINFFNSYIAEKNYPFIKEKVKLPKEETKGIFSNIKAVFIYKVSSVMINATDNTLISVLVDTATVGYYSNYTMIVNKISNVINTFFYALTASVGNLIVTEKEEKRYQIFQIMQSVSMIFSTFCITCLFFLEEDFIRLWLGSSFVLERMVLWAQVVNFYFSIILLPIWIFREAAGLYQKTKYVMLMTALINIMVSVVLGKWLGLAGIIFATSIARLVTYFWYEPLMLFRQYFGQSCMEYFIGIVQSILTTALVFGVAYLTSHWILVDNFLKFFVKAIIVGSVSLGMIILIYHRSDGFKLLKERVLVIVRSRLRKGNYGKKTN